jgi:hypothetical protein
VSSGQGAVGSEQWAVGSEQFVGQTFLSVLHASGAVARRAFVKQTVSLRRAWRASPTQKVVLHANGVRYGSQG